MRVLVDTCVWSLALRREQTEQTGIVQELTELISESRAQFIGPIRQELLSGIKEGRQFQKLKNVLQAFPDVVLETADYECAADFFNLCRRKGIQGSNTDFLICAVARSRNMAIFTVDNDFTLYQQVIPMILHASRF
jgi:predicted nucleic acid-binding protein